MESTFSSASGPPQKLYSLFAAKSKPTTTPTTTENADVENLELASSPSSSSIPTRPAANGAGRTTDHGPSTPPLHLSQHSNDIAHKLAANDAPSSSITAQKASSALPKSKKRASTPDQRRTMAVTARRHEEDDEEMIILSPPRPSTSASIFNRNPKPNGSSSSAIPVIVIPDSPPSKARSLPYSSSFKPLRELYKDTREKRKKMNDDAREPRWPTREEHEGGREVVFGGSSSLQRQAETEARRRWCTFSHEGKGKGKAIENGKLSPDYLDQLSASLFGSSSAPEISPYHPEHRILPLAQVHALLTRYEAHPLLDRLAAPFKTSNPIPSSFIRPNESTIDQKDLWTVKYAPKKAEEVLGKTSGDSAGKLKAWLQQLKISEERSSKQKKSSLKRTVNRGVAPKKKRRAYYGSDLEDFVASDDEEVDYDEMPDNDDDDRNSDSTVFPSLSNLILLVGPNGSGKTCAVHAVAEELGFEVFEVYPGIGKRTAKDIEKLVGDVGRNHTVRNGAGSPIKKSSAGLFAMFSKSSASKSAEEASTSSGSSALRSDGASPNQSLILFEEADVLCKDEKDFWSGLVNLTSDSRRPVILTCTDTSLIPFQDLGLQRINFISDRLSSRLEVKNLLPFDSPEPSLVVDYLKLVALNQGHLLTSESLEDLYLDRSPAPITEDCLSQGFSQPLPHPYPNDPRVAKNEQIPDLRKAMMQLQFECQWGVGDKNGIEWLDLSKEKEAKSHWSLGTLMVNSSDEKVEAVEPTRDIEEVLRITDTRSFTDAFIARRPVVELDDLNELPIKPAEDEMLDFITLPSVLPQLTQSLASSHSLEKALVSSVSALLPQSYPTPPSYSSIRQQQFIHMTRAAQLLIPSALIDAPAPVLPSPKIFSDYLPYLRQITAVEDRLEIEAMQAHFNNNERSRRSTRSSQAAKRRVRAFGWSEEEVELVRRGGFDGVEQDRWPDLQLEDESDPIENSQE